jgi:hypothetical protein
VINIAKIAVIKPATAKFRKNIVGTIISKIRDTRPATTKIVHSCIIISFLQK